MFFLLAITATLAYAVQSSLMAQYYRSIDRLSAVALRGLSLGVSMLPLLIFVSPDEFAKLPAHLSLLFLASLCAAVANLCIARSVSFLPIGIANGAGMSFAAIFTAVFAYFITGEILSPMQMVFGAVILAGMTWLGVSRSTGPLPQEFDPARGFLNSFVFGILIAIAYNIIGTSSRTLSPFLVGYCWEFFIGFVATGLSSARILFGGKGLLQVPGRTFVKILLFSAPTAIGTGCYTWATSIGPIAIATAIVSTLMVFTTLISYFLYGEKLTVQQTLLLLIVCSGVAGLKLFSS